MRYVIAILIAAFLAGDCLAQCGPFRRRSSSFRTYKTYNYRSNSYGSAGGSARFYTRQKVVRRAPVEPAYCEVEPETPTFGSAGVVLYDFYSPSCSPCRRMVPTIQRLERAGYNVKKVNTRTNRELASQYGVSRVPTFVAVENGTEVDRITGITSYSKLEAMLSQSGSCSCGPDCDCPSGPNCPPDCPDCKPEKSILIEPEARATKEDDQIVWLKPRKQVVVWLPPQKKKIVESLIARR